MAFVGTYSVSGPSSSITLSSEYKTLDELLSETKEFFPNTELALEGKKFEIPREHRD
jgi:hypothetical protein